MNDESDLAAGSRELLGTAAEGFNQITSVRSLEDVQLGQWYWVLPDALNEEESGDADSEMELLDGQTSNDLAVFSEDQDPSDYTRDSDQRWLGCVTRIGSNFVELTQPWRGNSRSCSRVHFDEFWVRLVFEPNAEAVIRARAQRAQDDSQAALKEIQRINARLGLVATPAIGGSGSRSRSTPGSNAVMVLSGSTDIAAYKSALIEAKEVQLPALFERVKEANAEMIRWMSAGALSMEAMAGSMKDSIAEIKSRIFTVSLYAGLAEEVVCCREGSPAAMDERLRVMQRRLYMDEECLMHYRAGGMAFGDIEAFDAWLAEPEHLQSILPFPRCMVAMRVRRKEKERQWDGSLRSAMDNIRLGIQDKFTFLYIRNGEQLYRLSTEIDFDELIFPSREDFDPAEPLMFKVFAGSVGDVITQAEYDQRVAAFEAKKALADQWERDADSVGGAKRSKFIHGYSTENPHSHHLYSLEMHEWHPFDPSSVYFDDAAEKVAERVQKYNRVAVIIQGLFDRSEVLHPHLPVQTWTPEGFDRAIELIYDGSDVLHDGQAPDFEAYRARCNASLNEDSVVVGQEQFWLEREAEKENNRGRRERYLRVHRPHGNPGPGVLSKMSAWRPKAKTAVFTWYRRRSRGVGFGGWDYSPIQCSLSVPANQLFNVSAYVPGDFKQFFQDRRTREQYLKWAPLLLTAEEYHAGNLQPQLPGMASGGLDD